MTKTTYNVNVYFDNMLDETYTFERKDRAIECLSRLKTCYRGQRLYRVEMEDKYEKV